MSFSTWMTGRNGPECEIQSDCVAKPTHFSSKESPTVMFVTTVGSNPCLQLSMGYGKAVRKFEIEGLLFFGTYTVCGKVRFRNNMSL